MAERKNSKAGMIKMALKIARKEGILRFWRGVVPSTIGNFPGQANYYLAYETSQEIVSKINTSDTKLAIFMRGFISGIAAEIAGGVFYVPADTIAQRLQVQSLEGFFHNQRLYNGPIDVMKRIYLNEGIRGLYRGYAACKILCLMVDITAYAPGTAVQWGSYEASKGYIYKALTSLENLDYIPDNIPGKTQYVNASSAGFAAMCAITSNNPLEILRIRTQLLEAKSKKDALIIKGGYIHLAKTILKEEGWRAFYRGLKIRLLVTVPSAMVALSGYEEIKNKSLL